jgi:hypothetical protein
MGFSSVDSKAMALHDYAQGNGSLHLLDVHDQQRIKNQQGQSKNK